MNEENNKQMAESMQHDTVLPAELYKWIESKKL